jgi:hypothetical protein
VQQDILDTFLDQGELTKLGEPTRPPNGKRISGLKLDHPRQLDLMSSLVRFSHVAEGDAFTTAELQAAAAEALGIPIAKFPLGGLRYELWKLRAKCLVESCHTLAVIGSYPMDSHLSAVSQTLRQDLRAPHGWGFFIPIQETESWPQSGCTNSTSCINPSLPRSMTWLLP